MAEKPRGVYVPLDVLITDDEDIAKVGMFGFALFVSGLTYAKRRKTDGYIPKSIVPRLMISPSLDEVAECHAYVTRLCESGLWSEVGDGYQIRNWPAWNPTEDDREKWAERKRKSRASHADVTDSVAVTASHAHVPPESRNGHTMSRHEVEEKRSRSKEPTPLATRSERDDPNFKTFYAAYPRKKEPLDAAKAYAKATRVANPDVILAGLERLKPEWASREPNKIPYPASWLNAGGWEDEPDAETSEPVFADARRLS